MAVVFKCKMCGDNLEVQEGMTVCECEYCGSKQTVPQLDDEKKIKAWVDFCWNEFTNDELNDNTSDISKYSRKSLTKELVKLMESLINK